MPFNFFFYNQIKGRSQVTSILAEGFAISILEHNSRGKLRAIVVPSDRCDYSKIPLGYHNLILMAQVDLKNE